MPDAEPATHHPEFRRAPPDPAGRRGRIVRAVAVALVLVVLAGVVLARGRDRFDGYMSSTGDQREHVIPVGDPVEMVFVDREKSGTPYLAVYADGQSAAKHFHARTGKKGEKSRITVPHLARRGAKVFIRWVVRGQIKARWVLLIQPPTKR